MQDLTPTVFDTLPVIIISILFFQAFVTLDLFILFNSSVNVITHPRGVWNICFNVGTTKK